MHFTIHSTALVDALAWAAKSLPIRPSTPVLAGLKMTVSGNLLTLSAFDYEQSAVAVVEVDTHAEGTVLVSGRLLADIARALPKTEVTVAVDGAKLLVRAKASKFSLQTMPVEEYPALPEQPTVVGSVDANAFAEAIRTVVPAAGRDDMLPVLTAVCVHIDPAAEVVTLAATDRFRLAVRKVPFTATPDAVEATVLVPARILDQWAKALTGGEGSRFTFGTGGATGNVFAIATENRSATVRLLDGDYPRFQALIPSDFSAESLVHAADLTEAVKRVALVAERSTPASLAFHSTGIVVSATADAEAVEEVEAKHAGGDLSIGFNVGYLQDGLSALGQREAKISLVASNKPAVIRPADDDGTFTYLLMPMRAPTG